MSAFFYGASLEKEPVVWLHLGLFLDIIELQHEILEFQQFGWQEKSVRSQKDIFFQEWKKMDFR